MEMVLSLNKLDDTDNLEDGRLSNVLLGHHLTDFQPKGQQHNQWSGNKNGIRKRLNPGHSLRMTRGIKGTRQKVIIMHYPSEINQNQLLLIRFPNLSSDDIIIPGMANLSFNIKSSSMADPKRVLVSK